MEKIETVISAINANIINDWQTIDNNISDISAASNIDKFLSKLKIKDFTEKVRDLFMQLALYSRNYESVKWGIGIAGINVSQENIEKLIILARHSELTLYVSHVIFRESEKNEDFKKYLIDLLPNSHQWGLIHIIDYIVEVETLIKDKEVQKKILIYGIQNNDGIPMEVCFTIAKNIDIESFIEQSENDTLIRKSTIELFQTLLMEPDPLGGILDLDDCENVFKMFYKYTIKSTVDIYTLQSLDLICTFLDDSDITWADREQMLNDAKSLLLKNLETKILKEALFDKETKWISLNLIRKHEIQTLVKELTDIFISDPNEFMIVSTLAEIADQDTILIMFEKIPEIVDLEFRKKQKMSTYNVFGENHENNHTYAFIIDKLWKAPNSKIIAHLKIALEDYDPHIRSSACSCVGNLPAEFIDKEMVDLIEKRSNETLEYVKESGKIVLSKIKNTSMTQSESN